MGFTQGLMLHVAALGFGGAAVLFLLGMQQLHQMVVEEDRTWMDPLPPMLKFIWPLIQIISFFFCSILPYEMMEKTDVRLQHSGVGYLLTPVAAAAGDAANCRRYTLKTSYGNKLRTTEGRACRTGEGTWTIG